MNPNKPLISDEQIDKIFPSCVVIEDVRFDDNSCNAKRQAARELRDIYESHLSTLTNENQSLKEKLEKAVECLKSIAYPLQHLQEEAKSNGEQLNGAIAIQISNDSNWLKEQATSFLKENQL